MRSESKGSQVNGLISHQLRGQGSEGQRSRSLSPTKDKSLSRGSSSRSDASRQSSSDLNFAFDEASKGRERNGQTAVQAPLAANPLGGFLAGDPATPANARKRASASPSAVHGIL